MTKSYDLMSSHHTTLTMKTTAFLLVSVLVVSAGQHMPATAAAATNTETENISSFQDDMWLYDENGKLSNYNLVYPLGCTPNFRPSYGYQHHAVTGDALKTTFPFYEDGGDCQFACLERGTDRSVAGHTLPSLKYPPAEGEEQLSVRSWFEKKCQSAEICLINYYSKDTPLAIEWVNLSGNAIPHNVIEYGERKTLCFTSYLGHKFLIKHNDVVIEELIVEHNLAKAFGESPPSGKNTDMDTEEKVIKRVEQTLGVEWRRQNKVKRTFSSLGFAKGRLPPDVFASMGAFFYNNRHNKVNEEWGGKGVYVNWWESNVAFIQIPWYLKGIWQVRLANLVSEWAQIPVEQTVMYGLRQYEDKARLLSHVDRTATHAVSLIVNVAQGGLDEPWPVEVFDHGGRLHEVLMEPGDIVYYESAKNLHSRNRPLKGKDAYYVNLFTHYRPIATGDKWFEETTPDGVPPPLIETEGSCRLVNSGSTAKTPSGQLGVVQEVRCDDPRLGPYVSPTFFEVKGVDDLMEWWRRTSPGYDMAEEEEEETVQEEDNATSNSEQDSGKEEL